MDFAHHLLFGGPREIRDTVNGTLDFMATLDCRLGLDASIRIYPRTGIERIARAEGILGSNTNLLKPHFYLSPGVEDILDDILLSFYRSVPKVRYFGRDGKPHPYTDARLVEVYKTGYTGPYWSVLEEYERLRVDYKHLDFLSKVTKQLKSGLH